MERQAKSEQRVTAKAPPRIFRGGTQFDPDEASDLRRRRDRELIETIVLRAVVLEPDDRELMLAIYRDNRRISEIAALLSVPPRRLRARVRRIIKRVLDPRFAFVARNREQWPTTRRRIATLRVLYGRTLRETAAQLELTIHQIRRAEDIIAALFAAETDARKHARAESRREEVAA
ncbi:MAG: hypothetical protein AAGI17_00295 [Planctomycetota bacterium]